MTTDLSKLPATCLPRNMTEPRNIWVGDNPLEFVAPVFLLQVSFAMTITGTMKFLFEPFGQSSYVSQMIGGIIAGPTAIGSSQLFKRYLFHPQGLHLFENFQYFGCMFYLFLVGVKMDISMVKRSGRKAWFIGVLCFLIPLILTLLLAYSIQHTVTLSPDMSRSIIFAAALMSVSSFHDIVCFLADLKLLNSELGRLATSSAMISGICSYGSSFVMLMIFQSLVVNKPHTFIWVALSCFTIIFIIVYLIRPIMFWMIKQTPEGKTVNEGFLFVIFVMVLLSSFFGEVVGQHFLLGPMILGIAVPVGPPLGAAIEDKLEYFVSLVLLPIYILANAGRIDFWEIELKNFLVMEFIALFSFFGKVLGAMIPALYCRMPYRDALLLGLIMNVQGVLDIQICKRALGLKMISVPVYVLLMLSTVILTGIISPIVKAHYDPSRRYRPYKRRSIQQIKGSMEFRILVCVYFEENVPSIISLLKASHPTRYSPICVYAVHLVQLQGRASPLLVAHRISKKGKLRFNPSGHVVNAFTLFEKQNEETVSVNCFTAISPYNTMHDDICTLGLERRTFLVIIPFHKQPLVTSAFHSLVAIRNVNNNVLSKAPCSVGILIDRGTRTCSTTAYADEPRYRVGVIFLGGADDREALAYGARIGERDNVDLTVVRFVLDNSVKDSSTSDQNLDDYRIQEFKANSSGKKHINYSEEIVMDGVAMVSMVRAIEQTVDLIMVGRQPGHDSLELLKGLESWSEFPELGVVGDLLATGSDTSASVLVVQQQAIVTSGPLLSSPKYCTTV